MEVLLRFLYGTTAVMAVPRRSWRCRGDPTADWPNPRWHGGRFEHVQSFRRAPRRSAVLTVFRGATAINDGTTAEPRRSWRCHFGLCRTSTAVASHRSCPYPDCRCCYCNQILLTEPSYSCHQNTQDDKSTQLHM